MDRQPFKQRAIAAATGIAAGRAWLHLQPDLRIVERRAKSALSEVELLESAVAASIEELTELREQVRASLGESSAGIIRAQQTIAEDESIMQEIVDLIRGEMMCAEGAVARVFEGYRGLFEAMPEDAYNRARMSDVEDVSRRIIRNLLGMPDASLAAVEVPSIVFAVDLYPSDTALMDTSLVRGFVTERGGATSHVAILAGTMGIPAIVGAHGILARVANGDDVLLDSDAISGGQIFLRPDLAMQHQFEERKRRSDEHAELVAEFHGRPAQTSDGYQVVTGANIGATDDIEPAKRVGARSVGLYRSEFLFLNGMSDEQRQFEAYTAALTAFDDGFVVTRTLDVGGDKQVPGIRIPPEDNPFLGNRGLRLLLEREDLFRTQLRAMIRASVHGTLRIMFPMVGGVKELDQALAFLQRCREELELEGEGTGERIEVGIMVEVPSAVLIADELAKRVDFFSIGTNDLTQYLLAADRLNGEIADYYRAYDPSVFRAIEMVVAAAHRHDRRVAICGELGGDPLAIPALVGLGVQEFSMNASRLAEVSWALSRYTHSEARAIAQRVLELDSHDEILALLRRELTDKEQTHV